ncbi:MAG: aminodeoxychorismate synthase component I [Glaciecola sp.]
MNNPQYPLGQLTIQTVPNVKHQHIVSLFASYQHQPWACLLDSCEQTQLDARYDIMAIQPCITYQRIHNQHQINGPQQSLFSVGNTNCGYQALQHLQQQFANAINTQVLEQSCYVHIPFVVGALAALSYDGNIHTDNIIDSAPNEYALPDISVGFYTTAIVFDNLTGNAYVCSTEPDLSHSLCTQLDALKHGESDIESSADSLPAFSLDTAWQASVSPKQYLADFTRIIDYLQAGDCYQVNYAQRFHAAYSGNEFEAYCTLAKVNKAPFSAFMRLPQSCILSVSPERFIKVNDGQVETKPIKGTRARSKDPIIDAAMAEELLSAEKDRAENLMIVDLLRNDLSKHCQADTVKVPKLFALESYPAVHHMVSTVIGNIKSSSTVYDLLKGAFPGGSITGAPKVRAMQVIQELEPHKRAIYCGSIGYIGIRNDVDTSICIRTLLAENQHLYCWGGGGIVIDSMGNDEYQESLHKLGKILPVLSTQEIDIDNTYLAPHANKKGAQDEVAARD